ncbi:MAG TPA: neutral zinc metallopeptidase [Burkholderiaceae bacterium]|nr:neutral zinc metallopeptidase [Burkholderiaceae bacterium]HQR75421.1 neutral zinc metallopeptidase [Burkholderiaceae bacterium]
MRIEGQSSNVEDRRGMSRGGRGIVGGGIGMIILVIVGMLFGIDPRVILGLAGTVQTVQQQVAPPKVEGAKGPLSDDMGRFVAGVLADTEKTWGTLFQQLGRQYQDPTLVLFTGATPTACGTGQAAMGPFYCPLDQKVYIDLAFYQQLRDRFKAPGDFAQAYVIAHEIGHHVQNQLGIMQKMDGFRQRMSETQYNALSVRLELQADCFAGVWAHHAQNRNLLEAGDVEEAMRAAAAIGDDTIQRRTQGRIVPDSFTHGTSEQRMRWFMTGMKSGQISACNTFEGNQI